MRRCGSTTAGSRRATTTDQEQERQDTEDTLTNNMYVMLLIFLLTNLHIDTTLLNTFESRIKNQCSTWQSRYTHIMQASPLKQITNQKVSHYKFFIGFGPYTILSTE
jgi:hypothetical protein